MIDENPSHMIAPCDGLLSVWKINNKTVLPVKQSHYTLESLLRNKKLAEQYKDGYCFVFRLCVNHYHRYCYTDSGKKSQNVFLPGVLHTVRPIALAQEKVFCENSREYTLIRTQTPQTFRLRNLIAAHEEAKKKGITNSVASCTLMAELGNREMHIVPGSEKNVKITTVEDLEIVKSLLHVQKDSWLK